MALFRHSYSNGRPNPPARPGSAQLALFCRRLRQRPRSHPIAVVRFNLVSSASELALFRHSYRDGSRNPPARPGSAQLALFCRRLRQLPRSHPVAVVRFNLVSSASELALFRHSYRADRPNPPARPGCAQLALFYHRLGQRPSSHPAAAVRFNLVSNASELALFRHSYSNGRPNPPARPGSAQLALFCRRQTPPPQRHLIAAARLSYPSSWELALFGFFLRNPASHAHSTSGCL